MRNYLLTLGLLIAAVAARAETDFLKNLPAADFTAAGLQKLTPEELARLESLFQAFKAGEVTEVRRQAEASAKASQDEADRKIVAAETKARAAAEAASVAAAQAREAEAKAAEVKAAAVAAPAGPVKDPPGWFKALLTLERAGTKPEKEQPLKSRLVGDFSGWSGQTIFTLEDGTRWKQQNTGERHAHSPKLPSPAVQIKPAALGGFWLAIEGVNQNVRVVPFALETQK